MATQTIKTTYSLDVETVRKLEEMARRWNISKSEALRRAIRIAAAQASEEEGQEALKALDQLQQSLNLDADAAVRWEKSVKAERRSFSIRRVNRAK